MCSSLSMLNDIFLLCDTALFEYDMFIVIQIKLGKETTNQHNE